MSGPSSPKMIVTLLVLRCRSSGGCNDCDTMSRGEGEAAEFVLCMLRGWYSGKNQAKNPEYVIWLERNQSST